MPSVWYFWLKLVATDWDRLITEGVEILCGSTQWAIDLILTLPLPSQALKGLISIYLGTVYSKYIRDCSQTLERGGLMQIKHFARISGPLWDKTPCKLYLNPNSTFTEKKKKLVDFLRPPHQQGPKIPRSLFALDPLNTSICERPLSPFM